MAPRKTIFHSTAVGEKDAEAEAPVVPFNSAVGETDAEAEAPVVPLAFSTILFSQMHLAPYNFWWMKLGRHTSNFLIGGRVH